ncbi:hypothetical protein, partial [Actinoallomurus sp. NPDC050550]|uniref:hypothetical protein n=1 Tax=Actinoallomurus sp. NPDC050550 TaxID=3154937 RepID=UPI003411A7DF
MVAALAIAVVGPLAGFLGANGVVIRRHALCRWPRVFPGRCAHGTPLCQGAVFSGFDEVGLLGSCVRDELSV